MITLFRRIRQKLIDSGSITKYLLYAIGEILLVVIGILIALQVNNWQSDRIDRQQEKYYLSKLIQNMALDTLNLNDRISTIKFRNEDIRQLKSEVGDLSLTEFSRDSLVYSLVMIQNFTPQSSTMENLISTGILDLIRNQALVDSLFIYYNYIDNYTEQINRSNDTYTRQALGPRLLSMKGGLVNLRKAFLSEADKIFIMNAAELKLNINEDLMIHYRQNNSRARSIIQIIKDEFETYPE